MPIDVKKTAGPDRRLVTCAHPDCDNRATVWLALAARRKSDKAQVGSASTSYCDDHIVAAFTALEQALTA
jgi:hypothetical protein